MLTVGKELLIGRTVNTNAHWAGGRLAKMGTMLKEVTTVDDDLEEIADSFNAALARKPDFLVVVGGLGPTPDDMTLQGLAQALGVELGLDDQALSLILKHYEKRGMAGIEITPARRKMATIPRGSAPVVNSKGTAPGVRIVCGKTVVYSLPGVPAEMRDIFRREVEPEVREKLGKLHRKYISMKIEGVYESVLAPLISDALKRHPGAYVKSHPRGVKEGTSRIELDVAVVGEDGDWADEEGEKIASQLLEGVRKVGGRLKSARGLAKREGS